MIFNRVFNGDDFYFRGINFLQERITNPIAVKIKAERSEMLLAFSEADKNKNDELIMSTKIRLLTNE